MDECEVFCCCCFVCLFVCLFFVCWLVHYGVFTDGSLGPVIRLISAVADKPDVHSYIHACSFPAVWMYFFQQPYCPNGISPMGSSGCLSPRKTSCDRVALPDLGCMLDVFLCFHTPPNCDMDNGIFNVRVDVNDCDCAWGCADNVRESALKVDSGRKIPCRTGESNLRQRRDGPML